MVSLAFMKLTDYSHPSLSFTITNIWHLITQSTIPDQILHCPINPHGEEHSIPLPHSSWTSSVPIIYTFSILATHSCDHAVVLSSPITGPSVKSSTLIYNFFKPQYLVLLTWLFLYSYTWSDLLKRSRSREIPCSLPHYQPLPNFIPFYIEVTSHSTSH